MNVVLLTCVTGVVFQRALSAYQLAHQCRENNFSCQVIDFVNDFTEHELFEYVTKFVDEDTLSVGISTSFLNDFKLMIGSKATLPMLIPEHIQNVCIKIKKLYPNVRICLGGAKALQGVEIEWVDDIFQGYSEDQFIQYLTSLKDNKINPFLKRINGKVIYNVENRQFDITKLEHRFTEQDCILPNEVLPIEISRGCIFKCKFCAFPLNGKKKLDHIRDYDLIRDELLYNYMMYGTTQYFFNDDTLNDSVDKLDGLHTVIMSLPFKIEFSCWMRLDLLHKNKRTIKLLKEMGLRTVFFGIESFNKRTLKSIGKSMDPDKVKAFLLELYNEHWDKEVTMYLGMIAGLPYETKEQIQESVDWIAGTPFAFHFEPLRLSDSGGDFYKSDFETNYAKYGYTLDSESVWSNEHMEQKDAELIATNINTEYAYKKNTLSGSYLFALLNHFSYNELKGMTVQEVPYKKLLSSRKKLIQKYKDLLRLTNNTR